MSEAVLDRQHGQPRPLARSLLDAPAVQVAPRLLGSLLIAHSDATDPVVVRIVEVEAYDQDDPASHSRRGRTARNASMFARAGTAYLYRVYGIHVLANVSVGPVGFGAAVLLRAGVIVSGEEQVRARRARPADPTAKLLQGPGRLTSGLGVSDLRHDGCDLLDGTGAWQLCVDDLPDVAVQRGPRIGISQGTERPWRFWVPGTAEVSAPR